MEEGEEATNVGGQACATCVYVQSLWSAAVAGRCCNWEHGECLRTREEAVAEGWVKEEWAEEGVVDAGAASSAMGGEEDAAGAEMGGGGASAMGGEEEAAGAEMGGGGGGDEVEEGEIVEAVYGECPPAIPMVQRVSQRAEIRRRKPLGAGGFR